MFLCKNNFSLSPDSAYGKKIKGENKKLIKQNSVFRFPGNTKPGRGIDEEGNQ